ncbi:hypothetical protein [Hyalangium gracile]|uniref:hypothetical protein n=1 Tax=Hyalangium gracile TaxID=394092 RepID=UPI001CCF4DBF|nr:hypothetical protein [Hyalangium gracile]
MSGKIPGVDAALLGFDAREMFMAPGAAWDDARRGTYLLRTDVRKPLSVDTAVWPSLFGEDHSDWRGPHVGLWDDLQRMQRSLGPLAAQAHWTIAISQVSVTGLPLPSEGEDWELLGFDIADAGLLSGLSNCGYEQATVAELRASWAPLLNEHHLFTEVNQALAFRELTDRRVPEHAPFFVCAICVTSRLPTSRSQIRP